MDFVYREKNKRFLKRVFIDGRGRAIGKPVYQALIGLELGSQRLVDRFISLPDSGPSFVNKNLTAVVKTFERPHVLKRLVRSIRRFYPDLHIVVADDSREPVAHEGVETVVLPFDSGVSAGRNAALARVRTPFVLTLDDDYVFCRRTRLGGALAVMAAEPRIDIMGGVPVDLPFYHETDYSKARLFPTPSQSVIPPGALVGGLPVYDKVANFFIARTERLREVGWDERLKRVEHADFFTRAKGRLVTVFNRELRCLHARNLFDDSYREFRDDGKDFEYLREKWSGGGH